MIIAEIKSKNHLNFFILYSYYIKQNEKIIKYNIVV